MMTSVVVVPVPVRRTASVSWWCRQFVSSVLLVMVIMTVGFSPGWWHSQVLMWGTIAMEFVSPVTFRTFSAVRWLVPSVIILP